ncbi:MAG: hypothetical protein MI922_06875 [Bacteroidales bacterium]|nr:hypothetical protein [Bacteroidales bacterium]
MNTSILNIINNIGVSRMINLTANTAPKGQHLNNPVRSAGGDSTEGRGTLCSYAGGGSTAGGNTQCNCAGGGSAEGRCSKKITLTLILLALLLTGASSMNPESATYTIRLYDANSNIGLVENSNKGNTLECKSLINEEDTVEMCIRVILEGGDYTFNSKKILLPLSGYLTEGNKVYTNFKKQLSIQKTRKNIQPCGYNTMRIETMVSTTKKPDYLHVETLVICDEDMPEIPDLEEALQPMFSLLSNK